MSGNPKFRNTEERNGSLGEEGMWDEVEALTVIPAY